MAELWIQASQFPRPLFQLNLQYTKIIPRLDNTTLGDDNFTLSM